MFTFTPFQTCARFMEALPPTAKHIAVLDRTKEDGSLALPLHLDVLATLSEVSRRLDCGAAAMM